MKIFDSMTNSEFGMQCWQCFGTFKATLQQQPRETKKRVTLKIWLVIAYLMYIVLSTVWITSKSRHMSTVLMFNHIFSSNQLQIQFLWCVFSIFDWYFIFDLIDIWLIFHRNKLDSTFKRNTKTKEKVGKYSITIATMPKKPFDDPSSERQRVM